MLIRSVLLLATSIFKTTGFVTSGMPKRLPESMRAIGFYRHLDIDDPNSLQDVEVKLPDIMNFEVLVEVKAVSVNPIDTKVRGNKAKKQPYTLPRILGWDGSGIVVEKGNYVNIVEIGDEVMFTGDIRKSGSNAQYVVLDQILIAKKPENLTFEEAAAMPLTSVTAYEALYDRLGLSKKDKDKSILIINSAGGVGSVACQLAKLLGLRVIGTASRPETKEFSKRNGADVVLNHTQDLLAQLEEIGQFQVDYIMVNFDPYPYWDFLMHAIKPQGKICLVVDCSKPVDIRPLKEKSITLVSEMMNTRIKYNTPDKERHRVILDTISNLLASGKLKSTLTRVVSPINAENLREAHSIIESKKMVGKLVLSGF